jgi:hypothetical protein
MVGVGAVRVKFLSRLAMLVTILLLGGCFWRSFPERLATHADVLVSMARKGADLTAAERLTAGTLPELFYPLERGEALAAEARRRSGDAPPPALAPFEELLVRYRAFCDHVDRLRRERSGPAAREALAPALAEVERAAAAVHAALRTG